MIASFDEIVARSSPENIDEHREAHCTVDPDDRAHGFEGNDRAVHAFGRIETDVAVAAVMVHGLVEVAEEDAATAERRLGILLHTLELLGVDGLLTALIDEALEGDDVGVGIEHQGFGLHAVASGTPDLLIVALDVARHIVVDHPADIALVDTHSECHRGADNLHFAVDETVLRAVALLDGEAGMIDHRAIAEGQQILVHRLGCLAADAVDDAGVVAVTLDEGGDVAETRFLAGVVHDLERDVGAVERTEEQGRITEGELAGYVVARQTVGSGRESHYGD